MEHNEITEQLEKIEALRNAYEVECKRSENSNEAIRAFHTWHMAAVELFVELFGEEDEQLKNFHSEGIPGNGYVLRDEYHAILGTYTMLKVRVKKYSTHNTTKNMQGQEKNIKPKKIFISHSHDDAEFAKALVNLLVLMGFEAKKEIFCSSVPDCWVEDGEDFIDVIKKHFDEYELYVIYIHSPRFYSSHISLNEMGAAWALQSDHSSFLTSDMDYKNMDGVIDDQEISIKVNADEAPSRLNDWKQRILEWFDKPDVDTNIWERRRNKFIEETKAIVYADPKQETTKLSDADAEKLKVWVYADDNELFQAWYSSDSAVFGLGAKNQYTVDTARDIAEWLGFFKRMHEQGFIEKVGYTKEGNHPKYQLTEKAYQYFDKE